MPENSPLHDRLVAPIPGSSPVGEDPKYLPDFEFVKAEIAKMAARDWEKIVASAESVLCSQSKDLTLLCWYLVATGVHSGWARMAEVSGAFLELTRTHWDAIHPTRERARANAFRWLVEERTMGTIEQIPFGSADHESLANLAIHLEGLRTFLLERFTEDPPAIKPLVQAILEKAKSTRPAPSAPSPAPTPTPAGTPSAAPAAGATSPAAQDVLAEGASRADILRVLQKSALAMQKADPDSVFGYKLLRMVRWQDLVAAPRDDAGTTQLAPPNPQRRGWIEAQYQQRNWNAILENSEAAITEPGLQFWFDLQFYAVGAFEGKSQAAVADAIRGELRSLLARVPRLADLKYSDGTPFASAPVRAWLEELRQPPSGGSAPSSSAVREDTLEADLSTARELASSGMVAEGIALLESGLAYGSGRSKAMRRMETARLALNNGKIRASLAQCVELQRVSREMSLATWEPDLGAAIGELHLRSLNAAIDAGLGPVEDLRRTREVVCAEIGREHPSLLARIDF